MSSQLRFRVAGLLSFTYDVVCFRARCVLCSFEPGEALVGAQSVPILHLSQGSESLLH
jgi:hypothetical protein